MDNDLPKQTQREMTSIALAAFGFWLCSALYLIAGYLTQRCNCTPIRKALTMADQNFKLAHAREFTDVETEVDQIWNSLQDANNGSLARDFLDAGLMEEHFLSLLDNDPSKRTADEIATLGQLHGVRVALAAKARAFLAGTVDSRGQ